MTRPRVVLAMAADLPARLFSQETADRLHTAAEVDLDLVLTEFRTSAARAVLAEAEVLLTGWGAPAIDAEALAAAPALRAVVHAAGTVKGHVGAAVFERGIVVSSAAAANALPVAEYTLAMILLAGKDVFGIARRYRESRTRIDLVADYPRIGNLGRTVGILGASQVGRAVLGLLRHHELRVLVHDPYLDPDQAAELGARWVELDELFASSEILSIHAPALPETTRMVNSARLALLPDGATLINTARGALIDHEALVRELRTGRISAVLDVTEPEVLPPAAQLWDLPNVIVTPHLAGSIGTELHRLGAAGVDEVCCLAAGRPLRHPVSAEALHALA